MGLKNVVWHQHFFPNGEWPEDDESDVAGRYDACSMEDGSHVVYSAERREVVGRFATREMACHEAFRLANLQAK